MNEPQPWTYNFYYWEDFFSYDEIKNINSEIEKNYEFNEDEKLVPSWKNVSSVKMIRYDKIKDKLNTLPDLAQSVGETIFGYTLFNTKNHEYLNHNTYDAQDKSDYAWHVDHSNTPMYDVKLTVLMNISDESYEGGDFQIFNQSTEATVKQYSKPGSVFMFKSHILHRVLPLVSGKRKTLAMFLKGPRFT